ncbi:AsmA-like C-terminal region-containing protein [Larkinella soli]|uniref:AsmA-like C-terminal region-containing protein n=1 Tax=Larkinella soli TaxID=1770527 RepID=UPI000FFBD00B|nr:AsmA-like C-terminal region-containing protein [Larkinella soli]
MAKRPLILKIVLGVAGILLVTGLLIPYLLTTVYGDRIVQYVRDQFSRHSQQQLADFQVRFSMLRNFPHLTIQLDDISVTDGQREVIGMDQARFVVGLTDFIRKRLTVRKVYIKGARFHQWVDSTGRKTAFLWETGNARGQSRVRPVNIPELRLEDASVTVENAYKKSAFALLIRQADLSGDMTRPIIHVNGTLDGTIGHVTNRQTVLFRGQPFSGQVGYDFNPATKTGTFHHTRLQTNGQEIRIAGSHARLQKEEGSWLDLRLKGLQPTHPMLASLFPDSLPAHPTDTTRTGLISFEYRIDGKSSPTVRPHTHLAFQLSARNYPLPKTPLVLHSVEAQGELDNGPAHERRTTTLTLQKLRILSGTDTLSVQGRLTDLTAPVVEAGIQGNLALRQLARLMHWPGDSLYGGRAAVALEVRSPLFLPGKVPPVSIEPFWKGTLKVKDGQIRRPGAAAPTAAFNADIHFVRENNMIRLVEVAGKLGGRSFRVNGEIANLLRYWLGGSQNTHPVRTNLVAYWEELDFSDVLRPGAGPAGAARKTASTDSMLAGFLFGTEYSALVRIGQVKLPSFENLENVSIAIRKKGETVQIPRLHLRTTLGGTIVGLGHFRFNRNGIQKPYGALRLSYERLNLQRLLGLLAGLNGIQRNYRNPTAAVQPRAKALKDYRFDLEVKAGKLDYHALKGTNFGLKAVVLEDEAQLERLTMQAFEGRLGARGAMKLDGPQATSYPVRLNVSLQEMNLNQLFRAAEEMNLDVLKSENIRGEVNCQITLRTLLDKDFLPNMDNTTAYTRASLRRMELIDVQPIQQALRFLPRSKTSHIYFEDVEAQFLLHRNRILMPDLNLNNNLSFLQLDGDYTLNKEASFLVEVSLTDLLFGNNRRRIQRIQEADTTRRKSVLKNHLFLYRDLGKYRMKVYGKRDFEFQKEVLLREWLSELKRENIDTTFTR